MNILEETVGGRGIRKIGSDEYATLTLIAFKKRIIKT